MIHGKSVGCVFLDVMHLLEGGVEATSRNGTVVRVPGPVLVEYENPKNHVLFGKVRDANPFFHLMEALWMLGGRDDVAFPAKFNANIAKYSDDGIRFHGAYGYRWRNTFGGDQLDHIAGQLTKDPTTRRAVLTMWHPGLDLTTQPAKDLPCNTHIYFEVEGDRLNMTVCNRSNDAIWGMLGANVVHFSILLEYMAARTNLQMGSYYQFTNNLHVYTDKYPLESLVDMGMDCEINDHYKRDIGTFPLITVGVSRWEEDLTDFLSEPPEYWQYGDPFFNDVANPMYRAWMARKKGDRKNAMECIGRILAPDWRKACIDWVGLHGLTAPTPAHPQMSLNLSHSEGAGTTSGGGGGIGVHGQAADAPTGAAGGQNGGAE